MILHNRMNYIKISGCCYLLNPAINPFLYSIFSKRFRRAFFDLLLKSNIRCFNKNKDDGAATATMRQSKNKPHKQVISRRAMLRHLDLKSSNGISKLSFAKHFLIRSSQKHPDENGERTLKVQSLHYFDDRNATPSAKLNSEPILCQKHSYIFNEDVNVKRGQTPINLKSGDRANSFYVTPHLIDESSAYQACKIFPNKERQNDYIYKVVFQSSPLK